MPTYFFSTLTWNLCQRGIAVGSSCQIESRGQEVVTGVPWSRLCIVTSVHHDLLPTTFTEQERKVETEFPTTVTAWKYNQMTGKKHAYTVTNFTLYIYTYPECHERNSMLKLWLLVVPILIPNLWFFTNHRVPGLTLVTLWRNFLFSLTECKHPQAPLCVVLQRLNMFYIFHFKHVLNI